MSDPAEERPVMVNGSAFPDQVMTALRSLMGIGLGYAVGNGWIDQATGTQLVGALVVIVPFAWSMYVSTRKHSKLKAVAQVAPDSVAQIK